MEHINKNYKFRNLLSFNLTGFFIISFVIFLTSSQPFYLNQVLKLGDKKIGKIIGTLGIIDEVTSIITSPLVGSLNDRINNLRFFINGSKIIVFTSFIIIAVSFLMYGLVDYQNWHQLIVPRIVFAIGITSGLNMVPVLLNQLIYSDFKFTKIFYWRNRVKLPTSTDIGNGDISIDPENPDQSPEDLDAVQQPSNNLDKNGKYSSMIGISTGLGAVFSVSFFLTLPVRLSTDYNLTAKDGLRLSFIILGCLSIVVGVLMLGFLYNSINLTVTSTVNYFTLLKTGWVKCRNNSDVKFACFGGFIARSTSVLIAVFIPLFVYNFYYKSGICDADGLPSKTNCYDGYIFSAILTGVSQTIGLVSSPFWGICADRFGKLNCLIFSSVLGLCGNWLIILFQLYDPRNALTFVLVSLIGVSQIGTIITSMSLISVENDVVGSISGIYNLCGGVGILLLNQFGGMWSDYWIFAPFFLMGCFNVILILTTVFFR